VLAIVVAAGVSGIVFVSGAAIGGMFFSTMPAVSPTFADLGNVSVTIENMWH
jgi:hypothetical protein